MEKTAQPKDPLLEEYKQFKSLQAPKYLPFPDPSVAYRPTFLLSLAWYRAWQEFVGIRPRKVSEGVWETRKGLTNPGTITNADLLLPATESAGFIVSPESDNIPLKEGAEFKVLTDKQWEFLSAKYGATNPIRRPRTRPETLVWTVPEINMPRCTLVCLPRKDRIGEKPIPAPKLVLFGSGESVYTFKERLFRSLPELKGMKQEDSRLWKLDPKICSLADFVGSLEKRAADLRTSICTAADGSRNAGVKFQGTCLELERSRPLCQTEEEIVLLELAGADGCYVFSNNHEMTINVRTLTGKTYRVECRDGTTVKELKDRMFELTTVAPDKQNIVFAQRKLAVEERLGDCGVYPEAIVHIVFALGRQKGLDEECGPDYTGDYK